MFCNIRNFNTSKHIVRSLKPQIQRRFVSSNKHANVNRNRNHLLAAAGFAFAFAGVGFSSVVFAKNKDELRYKHVIIGAGVAARSCVNTLNSEDKSPTPESYDGKVLMVGNDSRMNTIGYSNKDHEELQKPSYDPSNNLLLGHTATKLDVHNKTVELHDGTVVKFDKCFLATGGVYPEMKNVSPAASAHVTTFRRTQDLEAILEKTKSGEFKHVTVVGGGALGTEIALELQSKGGDIKVAQVYAEPGTMHRNLPDYFRAYCTALLRSRGIDQKNFSLVSLIDIGLNGKINVTVDSWEQYTMETDHIIFAPTHIDANSDLAGDAGLEIDQNNSGICVNSELLAFSDVFVGGDAASYPSKALGRRRDQNYDHAVSTGEVAAKNMLGARQSYDHIPVSHIFMKSIGMQHVLVGNVDARLETIGFWEMNKTKKKGKTEDQYFFTSKYNKGAVFYLDSGKVVGVMLTNMEDKDDVGRARSIISDTVDYSDLHRQDLETELRELVGFELQVPLIRSTFGKGGSKKKKSKENPYKNKRSVNKDLARHPSDTVRDANTNLYWRSN